MSYFHKATRAYYEAYLQDRDQIFCDLVKEHGINKTAKLTGWSKPTIITAVRKFCPELLRSQQVEPE